MAKANCIQSTMTPHAEGSVAQPLHCHCESRFFSW